MGSVLKLFVFLRVELTSIMKQIFCLFLFVTLLLPLKAQKFIGGVVAGMNLSQVEGDEVNGFKKVGFNGGGLVMLPLNRKKTFFATVELLYNQKGAYQRNTSSGADAFPYGDTVLFDPGFPHKNNKIYYNLRTDYVEVPLLFHYEDPMTGYALGVGASWARLVFLKETLFGRRLLSDIRSGRFYRDNWNFLVDVRVPIYKGLKFTFRYQYSFVPIGADRVFYTLNNADSFTRKMYHHVLSFRFMYTFNDRYYLNQKTNPDGSRRGPRWDRVRDQ